MTAEIASNQVNVPKGQNCFVEGLTKQKEPEKLDLYKLYTITCGLSLQSSSFNTDKTIISDSTSYVSLPPTNLTANT